MGEQINLVFSELGITAQEIQQLINDGVIGGRAGKD
jgi:hypothetical protein